jgi:hypothetical protein
MPRWVDARQVTFKYGLGTELDARGKTCAGLWVMGTGMDGQTRDVYLYHVVDRTQAHHPMNRPGRPRVVPVWRSIRPGRLRQQPDTSGG